MKGFASSRSIIAGTQRITAHSAGRLIMSRPAGSGIWSQTLDGESHGFDAPIVEREDDATDSSFFFIQSEKFADRYYVICQRPNGDWYFSGDGKLAEHYISRVWAFLIEESVEVATAPSQRFIAPILNGPWNGITVYVSDKEMAAIKARVKARDFAKVCAKVRAIERRTWEAA